MKKGDRVYINKNAKYSGQDMDWTELKTGAVTLKVGQKIYHSSDTKIKTFYPKETCFYTDGYADGYVYCLILKKEIIVPAYDNEVRVDLSKLSKDDYELYYIGTKRYDKTIYNKFGFEDHIQYKNNVLKEFDLDLEKQK